MAKKKKEIKNVNSVFSKTDLIFSNISKYRNNRILRESAEKNMYFAIFFMICFYFSIVLSNYFFLEKIKKIEPMIAYTSGKVEKINLSKEKIYKMQESIKIIKEGDKGE